MDIQVFEKMVEDKSVSDDALYDAFMEYITDAEQRQQTGKPQQLDDAGREALREKMYKLRPLVMERFRLYLVEQFTGCGDDKCGPKYSGGCSGCDAKNGKQTP